MATRRHKEETPVSDGCEHVIHTSQLSWATHRHGAAIEARTAAVASRIGAKKLGYRLVELSPGKAAYQNHFHYANEEMFYVLEGTGTLRLGPREFPVQQGDFISVPAADEALAHQLVNTSSAPLRYLAVSTMLEPDVVVYPDNAKIAAYAGAAPGGSKEQRSLEYVGFLHWPASRSTEKSIKPERK